MKILATLDGSPESRQMLPVLYRLAMGLGAEVTFLSVVEPQTGTRARVPGVAGVTPGGLAGVATGPTVNVEAVLQPAEPVWLESKQQAIEGTEAEARDWLEEAAAPLVQAGLEVRREVLMRDKAATAIVDFARQHGFDLIVMATHGRTGLREVVQGSVAAAVMKSGVAPVLMVRPKAIG